MAPDKVVHLKGGLGLLALALPVTLVMGLLGAHWLAIGLVNAGLAGAGAVEGAQWAENRSGRLPRRDVSLSDFLHSAVPCWAAAAVAQLAASHFGVPQWPS